MGTQVRNFNCLIENPLAGVEYFYLDKKYQVVLSYLELYSFLVKTLLMWARGMWKKLWVKIQVELQKLGLQMCLLGWKFQPRKVFTPGVPKCQGFFRGFSTSHRCIVPPSLVCGNPYNRHRLRFQVVEIILLRVFLMCICVLILILVPSLKGENLYSGLNFLICLWQTYKI